MYLHIQIFIYIYITTRKGAYAREFQSKTDYKSERDTHRWSKEEQVRRRRLCARVRERDRER